MKTTLNLDDELLRRAKGVASARGTTLTSVVEDALRASLVGPEPVGDYRLALPTVRGDRAPAFDVADRRALHDAMADGEEAWRR